MNRLLKDHVDCCNHNVWSPAVSLTWRRLVDAVGVEEAERQVYESHDRSESDGEEQDD